MGGGRSFLEERREKREEREIFFWIGLGFWVLNSYCCTFSFSRPFVIIILFRPFHREKFLSTRKDYCRLRIRAARWNTNALL